MRAFVCGVCVCVCVRVCVCVCVCVCVWTIDIFDVNMSVDYSYDESMMRDAGSRIMFLLRICETAFHELLVHCTERIDEKKRANATHTHTHAPRYSNQFSIMIRCNLFEVYLR